MQKIVDDRARQSLRLDGQIWAAIDLARGRRAGTVSRNTWITEAIIEKITREHAEDDTSHVGDGRRA